MPVGGLDLPALVLDFAEEPCVLDRKADCAAKVWRRFTISGEKLPLSFRQTVIAPRIRSSRSLVSFLSLAIRGGNIFPPLNYPLVLLVF